MTLIDAETPADIFEIEDLLDTAFGPGRGALSSYRLRDGVDPVAAAGCVARDPGGALVGTIRFWPVSVAAEPVLLLGPIAVHPTRQGEGLGAALMAEGLARAAGADWARVLLVGDRGYYRRFGFVPVPVTFPPPTNPDRVLGRGLSGDWGDVCGAVRPWSERG
ncbi:MAG: N-acetyltransferase [Pseudomonadota bacterium]